MKHPKPMIDTRPPPEKAFLIHVVPPRGNKEQAARLLSELDHLARGVNLVVVASEILSPSKIITGTYLGKGTVARIAKQLEDDKIEVVVFNNPLSPIQQRNLEKTMKTKVVDRTGVILEIFASRARTNEGILQVELASLLYQQSRLVRSWTHLERQRGGVGLRGGPGETQIETDRRLIRQKIQSLKRSLKQVERTRTLQREARREVPFFTAALVGYTNAGKSTLFNRLSGAKVMVADQLFATLDPTLRQVTLPNDGRMILGDTVGFIRSLPHQLVAAFRATLEEVLEADLLLHVVDISDPDWEEQEEAVIRVLRELGAEHKKVLTLFNKVDQLEKEGLAERLNSRPDVAVVSAVTGQGIEALLTLLEKEASRHNMIFQLHFPGDQGALLARLCREGQIIERQDENDGTHLTVSLSPASAGRLMTEMQPFFQTQ